MRRPIEQLALALVLASAAPAAEPPVPNAFQKAIAYAQKRCVRLYGGGAGREHGYATGLLVSADGLILTAQGVYLVGSRVRAVLPDGTVHEADILRRSDALQAALLKVDARTPDFFDLAAEATVRQGDWVLGVSNLFNVAAPGEPLSVNLGVVSVRARMEARHRAQDVPYEGDILLVDAITSNPGAPGGALVAADGRLVGMLGKLFQSTSTNTRVNYAVPVDLLKAFVEGKGDGPAAPPAPPAAEAYVGLRLFALSGKSAPAYVDAVAPDSPAHRAGLRKDDLVLTVGSEVVRNVAECQDALKALKAGRSVPFVVKRKQTILSVTVTPEERAETPEKPALPVGRPARRGGPEAAP
jgi:serine protease Do